MICDEINALLRYALEKGLIDPCDEIWARNSLLDILGLDGFAPTGEKAGGDLEAILKAILDDAAARCLIDGGITSRDLLDTRLEGGDRLVLPLLLRHGLHPPLPHREGPQVEGRDGVRRARRHDQPLQAGEGSARDRRGPQRQSLGLPEVPALPRGGGLRRARRLSGARKPPHHPDPARGGGLVFAVFALRLL